MSGIPKSIAIQACAFCASIAVAVLVGQGCHLTSPYKGVWKGVRRDLKFRPEADPALVNSAKAVVLVIAADGRFEMIDRSLPTTGTVNPDGTLNITTINERAVLTKIPARVIGKGGKLVLEYDGTVELEPQS